MLAEMEGFDLDRARRAFAEWEVLPIERRGQIAGAFFLLGPEIHVSIKPDFRKNWFTPRLWRKIFVDRKNHYGHLITQVQPDNQSSIDFIERAGFVRIGVHNGNFLYERV